VKVVIVMDGGLIQNIVTSEDAEIMVIDYEKDDYEPEDMIDMPQVDGTTAKAHIYEYPPEVDKDEAGRCFAAFDI